MKELLVVIAPPDVEYTFTFYTDGTYTQSNSSGLAEWRYDGVNFSVCWTNETDRWHEIRDEGDDFATYISNELRLALAMREILKE